MEETTAQELRAELAKREYAELQECIQQLQQMAGSLGFEIIAIPQLTQDGRLTAQWGVRRAQG